MADPQSGWLVVERQRANRIPGGTLTLDRQPNSAFNFIDYPCKYGIDSMDKNVILHLGVFIAILLALNFFFHLHISIIGSLVLTVGLSLVSGLLQR